MSTAKVTPIKQGAKEIATLYGATTPRIMTAPLKGKSLGADFAEFAEKVGYPLLPWQKYISEDFFTVGDDDLYIRKMVMVCVSRQCGKTYLLALRILFGLFVTGERNIVAISSKRGMAEDTFDKVCQIAQKNEFLRERCVLVRDRVGYRGNGKQHLDLKDGGKYEVCAATADGTRGKSADVLIIDELASVSPEAWASAVPVTIAKKNSQIYLASNAGNATSVVLNELREKALSYPSPALGWYEYSAPQHSKPDDPKALALANPALGYTITLESLKFRRQTMNAGDFLREHLCMWVGSISSPWPIGAWEALADVHLSLPIGPTTYFAFDKSKQGQASLVAGQIMPDGKLGVGLLQVWKPESNASDLDIASKIKEYADTFRPVMICFDHYATASIATRLMASNLRLVDVTGQEFWQASGDLLDAIVSGQIRHQGQELLDLMMQSCAAKTSEAGWRIVRRNSAGDVSGAIALAMIVHKMNEPVSVPLIIAG